jgi:hypothetical protein
VRVLGVLDAAAVALLAAACGVALANAATAPRLHRAGRAARAVRVSVLVPARDEAENLRSNLPSLLRQDHGDYEVIVLDDASADDTAAVVRTLAAGAPDRLRLIAGAPLPPQWTGKNWACHQLSCAATGDVLLFCDADVHAAPDAVGATAALLERHGAGALTALPRQRTRGLAEAAVVPLVAQVPVMALLPLWLVPRVRGPALSMGNGQWLAMTRDAYAAAGGHAAVRADLLEDVRLARRAKATGARLVVALASRTLEVRMYHGWGEVRDGFRKNLYPLLGGSGASFAAGMALFSIAAVYPWAAVGRGTPAAVAALALLVGVRAVAAAALGHGWRTVALHPAGAMLALWIAASSFAGSRAGAIEWKRRVLPAAAQPDSPG